MLGCIAAAQTPNTPPAVKTPEPPKQTVLSELQQAKVELALTRLQLIKQQENALNAEAEKPVAEACIELGGRALADCNIIPPNQSQPRYTVSLKPPVVAKKEEPKK